MLIKEYRITLPLSLQEYEIAQLYTTCQMSKSETGGGEGVEILQREPFTDRPLFGDKYDSGIFTWKKYYLSQKLPNFVRYMMPSGKVEIHEKSWNAFPFCKTILTNPQMDESFFVTIDTIHLEDRGEEENALQLDPRRLELRDVVFVDIANEPVLYRDFRADQDTTNFTSALTGRGPLSYDWKAKANPVMTCYKLVTCCFDWYGLEGRVERLAHAIQKRLFLNFHRKLFCWMDEWYGLNMASIRKMEERTQRELKFRIQGKTIQVTCCFICGSRLTDDTTRITVLYGLKKIRARSNVGNNPLLFLSTLTNLECLKTTDDLIFTASHFHPKTLT